MSDWFNWTNFWYLAGLMLAGGATFVGLKYKKLVDEIRKYSRYFRKPMKMANCLMNNGSRL